MGIDRCLSKINGGYGGNKSKSFLPSVFNAERVTSTLRRCDGADGAKENWNDGRHKRSKNLNDFYTK